jgi:hypothetical protein
MATVAVFLALGGGAYALSNNSVKSRHIDDGEVKTPDLDESAVTGAKINEGAVKSSDVGDGELSGDDIADGAVSGQDVDEAGLPVGGELTGTVANAELADEAVDANALAPMPFARLELPRDASDCSSELTIPPGTIVDIPWLSSMEGGGVDAIPACGTDFIAPMGGFYLTTVRLNWRATGGANHFTLEIARVGTPFAGETIPVAIQGQEQTVAMATSAAQGAAITARASHDGGSDATISGGEMVVHYLGPTFPRP